MELSLWKLLLLGLSLIVGIIGVGLAYFDLPLNSLFTPELPAGEPETFLLSQDPLIVYIKNFISPKEAAHLVSIADGRFAPSILWDNNGKPHRDNTYRSSMTAKLPKDNVIAHIESRARDFPFYKSVGDFQPMVVQNYGTAGLYRDHFDWYDDAHAVGGNVASTFFVYIYANCTGGGTNFPRLTPPEDEKWCEFIDCDRPVDDGITFLPILGNAVYWENIDMHTGAGNPKTLHSGMPVTSGNKMGLNMWTWKTA